MNEAAFEVVYRDAVTVARERSAALSGPSLIARLARLPRRARADVLARFTPLERAQLAYAWSAWASPRQDPDLRETAHRIVLWMGGRGSGKTRSAAERVRRRIYAGARRLALVGPTVGEIEKFMLGTEEVDEGLLNAFHPRHRPRYIGKPDYILKFHTGAIGYAITAEKPEFRGANLDTVWADEPIKWRFLPAMWSNIELATRAVTPVPIEILISTTPRPLRWLKEMVADPDVVTLLARSDDNPHNDEGWLARMKRKIGGTRLGEQELEGNILGDNPGALFSAARLDRDRVELEPLNLRKVVAVDPAISTERRNDPTGIVLVGADEQEHLFVLADRTDRHSAEAWARIVVDMYDQHAAAAIVYEKNRGGNLIEPTIRAAMAKKRGELAARALVFVAVHATKGKDIRAEPIQAIHEQGRLHIVGRELSALEDEITSWDPTLGGRSPNRLDAMVWGCWYLARVGDDAGPDYSAGFRGLAEANATLQRQAATKTPAERLGPARPTVWPSTVVTRSSPRRL